jgi:gluconolactonase
MAGDRRFIRHFRCDRRPCPGESAGPGAGQFGRPVYITDPRYSGHEPVEQPVEGVYRIDPDGTVVRIIDNAGKPNGIVISPDGRTLYVASVEGPGRERRGSGPDGMAVDVDGSFYLARPSAQPGVYVVSPQGEQPAWLTFPAEPADPS